MTRILLSLALICLIVLPGIASAQGQAPQGRLLITVADPSNGVIPSAKVTITGAEPATAGKTIEPVLTSPQGVATIVGLAPGRYTIQAEFDGLETTIVRDVRVNAGDNRRTMVLQLPRLQDSVSVGVDRQIAAADRTATLGTALTREQIEALPDDPDQLRQQLIDIAGIDAVIRVDTFEGASLPPKAQIKSIHVTRDAFAAENHSNGGLFVDIITQPGIGGLRGGVQARLRDSALNARNPFASAKGPERAQSYNFNVGGTIKENVSSFSLSVGGDHSYTTPISRAATLGGTVSELIARRVPQDDFQLSGLLDYALTRDQTLRMGISAFRFTNHNQGIGSYDLSERGYSSGQTSASFRVQEAGPLGRRLFINTRANIGYSSDSSQSNTELPTVIVNDAFTSGGAQRRGGRRSLSINFSSDLDYIRGIHSIRTGITLLPQWARSNDQQNYLGTYTFESLDAYQAGTPRSYTRRIGDPNIDYFYLQGGWYVQDDIRVRRGLTLSPGVRIEGVTHVSQRLGTAPRFGVTWAPSRSGRTTLRSSAGIFYDWLPVNGYEQSLRTDGFRQQELNIVDPAYDPVTLDPGNTGLVPAANRYVLGDNLHYATFKRLSAGIDQTLSPRLRVSATYAYLRASHRWRGDNINAPVNGVRPDPAFANLVIGVSDGRSITHSLSTNFSLNLAPMAGPAGAGRPPSASPQFDWRRMSVNGGYTYAQNLTTNDATVDGIFAVPFTGTVEGEWGPTNGDVRHRLNVGINSTALRNLNANFNFNASSAPPYNIKTGLDDNGDLIFNDRPVGVSRNSARGNGQWSLNGNFSYAIPLGRGQVSLPPGVAINAPGGGAPTQVTVVNPQAASRYRLQLIASIQNITNHYNYGGYNGTMTSPLFGKPQSVFGTRNVNFGVGLTF